MLTCGRLAVELDGGESCVTEVMRKSVTMRPLLRAAICSFPRKCRQGGGDFIQQVTGQHACIGDSRCPAVGGKPVQMDRDPSALAEAEPSAPDKR